MNKYYIKFYTTYYSPVVTHGHLPSTCRKKAVVSHSSLQSCCEWARRGVGSRDETAAAGPRRACDRDLKIVKRLLEDSSERRVRAVEGMGRAGDRRRGEGLH
jgi:hypothetical protein